MNELSFLPRSLLALLLLAGASPSSQAQTDGPDEDVRLLVLVVVDQMIPEQLDRLAPWLTGGFGRFLAEGEVWRDGAHGHGVTETGPGHASIGTGVHPNRHGIVANSWPASEARASIYCAVDTEARPLTSRGVLDQANEGRSPNQLAVEGISDFMKSAVPAAKCVGVSTKDRAAVLAMGRSADWSLWWDTRGQGYMSSTHFGTELPPWVVDWNTRWTDRVMVNGAKDFSWRSDLPADIARAGTAADSRTGEAGLLGKGEFPHLPDPFSTPRQPNEIRSFASNYIYFSPYADRFTIEMARLAVENMELGGDEHPDFLFVGLSACDTTGHLFGPYSAETTDLLLKTDRELGTLFEQLDQQVGVGKWIAALTADHGVMELPERLQARGLPARRVSGRLLSKALAEMQSALTDLFGDSFFVGFNGGVRFSKEKATAAGVDVTELRSAAAEIFAETAGAFAERTFSLDELLVGPEAIEEDPLRMLMSRSVFAGRSPDVLYVGKWGQLMMTAGTSHGSPWPYDRRVPIAFLGPGTTPGQRHEPCLTVDILPTLLHRGGLPVPEGLDGRVLE